MDVYFDNVGGEILDAALANINKYGRVINCGAISLYNKTEKPTGPRVETTLIKNSILMQGFTVRDFVKDFGPAQKQLAAWMEKDKLSYLETVVEVFSENLKYKTSPMLRIKGLLKNIAFPPKSASIK